VVARLAAIAIALVLGLIAQPARAEDRVTALTRQLASPSDKTRLAAALALAKLGEPAVMRPLVTALRDPSPRVRAVAATALGRLEYAAALPALRTLSTEDRDADVRKAAGNAAIKLATVSRRDAGDGDVQARRAPAGHGVEHAAALGEPHPDLYLLVNSSADESPGNADKATRQLHAEIIKRVLADQLRTEPTVTTVAGDARTWGLDARHLDLSVTRLEPRRAGSMLELVAELRLTISDDNGKMLSFLSGGAKVQVPSKTFDTRYLPALRKEALETAMRGMFGKLLGHLHNQTM
jgi:hypothetical protein